MWLGGASSSSVLRNFTAVNNVGLRVDTFFQMTGLFADGLDLNANTVAQCGYNCYFVSASNNTRFVSGSGVALLVLVLVLLLVLVLVLVQALVLVLVLVLMLVLVLAAVGTAGAGAGASAGAGVGAGASVLALVLMLVQALVL